MADVIPDHVITAASLLAEEDETVRALFQRYASGLRSPKTLEVSSIAKMMNISQPKANQIAKNISKTGAASYYIGRRGFETRLEFDEKAKLVNLSQLVLKFSQQSPQEHENFPSPSMVTHNDDYSGLKLTIPEAKKALARSLGIDASNIEITIKY